MQRSLIALSIALTLTACGGSSSDDDDVFGQCTAQDQNRQLISELRDNYLWNDELPSTIDPRDYANVYQLLADVVPPRDRFSFILTEQEYEDIYINATFFGLGFGRQDDVPNGVIRVRYVYQNSPAGRAGLTRGSEITSVNGVAMSVWYQRLQQGSATWDDVFGPNEEGVEVALEWRRPDGAMDDDVLLKEEVETNTVMAVERFQQGEQDIGYFVFDSFINRAAQDVNDAFDQLIGVDELVIDLRYNGGGLIRVANQIASQTAWHEVEHETFVTYQFNDNYDDQSVLFDLGQGIERLNLDRVVVLTTAASCSASELVINSLTPFIDVVTVGQPTCGKPVGQQPTPICDKIIFAINFQTVNAEGFGDYFDGLEPTCQANDTVRTDWGDPADPLLGEALYVLANGSCSATSASAAVLKAEGAEQGSQSFSLPQSEAVVREVTDKPERHPLLDKWTKQH
ncbi:MAG: peptidase S41 [Idiomarina sp.]|nr:peptidase S41 [Idiomarina sp.]